MKTRRMITKLVYYTEWFLKLSPTTRDLYTYLVLSADDDGVVEAGVVMRLTKAAETDLKLLVYTGYITALDEKKMIYYINDWLLHNTVRADRKTNSIYKELLLKVIPDVKLVEAKQRSDRNKLLKLDYIEKDITDESDEDTSKDVAKTLSEIVEKLFAQYDMSNVLKIFRKNFSDELIYKQLQNLAMELQKDTVTIKNKSAWLYAACDRDYPLKETKLANNEGNHHDSSGKKKNSKKNEERNKRQIEALRKELD